MPAERLHLLDATLSWRTRGGVRRYLLAKRHWLRQHGWRHTLMAPGARGEGSADCGGLPLPLAGGRRLAPARAAAARQIERLAPDLIELHETGRLAWAGLDAADRLGVPAVAFCHADPAAEAAHWAGGQGPLARAVRHAAERSMRRLYRRYDLVLAPSRQLAGQLEALGVPRVALQPLGVNCALFHPQRRDAQCRRALGLPEHARLLVHVGRHDRDQRLPMLAEAVQRLGPPYVLVAVGSGGWPPPRGPQVRVLPPLHDDLALARLLASADAYVQAGAPQGAARAALEALACGTPLVGADQGALSELLHGGAMPGARCGIAVSSVRAAGWAEAIAALFSSDLAACSRAARQRAEAADWSAVLPALLGHYRALLHAGAGPVGATQPGVLWHAPGAGGNAV